MKNIRKMVVISLLITLQIVFCRLLGIQTPIVRISFGYLPIAFSAMLFGPSVGASTAMLADIIGMLLFPKGAYFPGFTLSAAMGGILYGLFLYKRSKSLINISMAVISITLFVNLGLNSLWISIINGQAIYAIITIRIIKNLIVLPIKILLISVSWKAIGTYLEKKYSDIMT